jgi:hypothetical protein
MKLDPFERDLVFMLIGIAVGAAMTIGWTWTYAQPQAKETNSMSKQHAVFLERRHKGERDDERRCVTVEPAPRQRGSRSRPELMLQILGADQSASEFLKREQFEELVANARRVMGWEGERLVMEGKPLIETQDGGQALIAEINSPDTVFVRLQSWDETREHGLLKKFIGAHDLSGRGDSATGDKKLRVTVEVI